MSSKREFARFYERCKDAPNWLPGAGSRADKFVCSLIARQRDMSMKRSEMRMQHRDIREIDIKAARPNTPE